MKKVATWVCTSVCAAAFGSMAAVITTTGIPAHGATVSPFDPEFDEVMQFTLPLSGESETITLSEAVTCLSEAAAEDIARAFEKYGTRLRFSVAYETYRMYWPGCSRTTNYPLEVAALPLEPRTFAQLHGKKKAFVVNTGILYVVVARPEVFDAVFRTCNIQYQPAGAGFEIEDPDSCWRDL